MRFRDRRRQWRKRIRRYFYGTIRRPAEVIVSLWGPIKPLPLVTNEYGHPAFAGHVRDDDGGSP